MIPVVYIHFGVLPNYLKRSINQSLKFNNKVVLITDIEALIPGVDVVDSSLYNNQVNDFENAYVHMSSNKPDFEKICIKRWIVLANYVSKNNIDVCYYSDSDVMLYANINDVYPAYQNYDAAYTLPEYQDNYRWTASACCSFWKKETLFKFSKFIIDVYTGSGLEKLKEKWTYHQQHNIAGGVCDMTLLYLFSNTINFCSLTKVVDGITFDQNYIDSENYYKNEYELVYDKNAEKKVKKINWKAGIPYGYNLVNRKETRFVALTEYARYVDVKNNVDFKTKVYRLVKRIENKLRNSFKKEKPHGWFGNYSSWQLAKSECGGYDAGNILNKVKDSVLKVRNGEAVYERDSVLFDEIQYSPNLIDAFKKSIVGNQLHVVDFGGSLGSTYFQHKELFKDIKDLKWSVVEQKHFVDCGKNEIEIDSLRFYYTVDEALQTQKPHVLLLSSVIPYFEKPYELIELLLTYNFEYIIVDRTAFIEGAEERITKQIVPEFIYKASYPAWFLNEKKFVDAFLTKYNMLSDFSSAFDSDGVQEDGARVYRKGFYFRRK